MSMVQLVIQVITVGTGLLLIRTLDKQNYALFTIAASAQTMLNLITDCGINSGLMSIGGQIWADPMRLARLVATALRLRLRLSIIAGLAVSPISIWLLLKNGASVLNAVAITGIVVAGTNYVAAGAVYAVVIKLHSRYWTLQTSDLVAAVSRFGLCLVAALSFLNAAVAIACGTLSQLFQYFVLKQKASKIIVPVRSEDPQERKHLMGMLKTQAPYFVFYSLQGQLSIFLISTFGNTTKVADVGALSRLGVIQALYGSIINYIICPAFARASARQRLLKSVLEVMAVSMVLGLLLIWAAWLFAGQILWVFGPNYTHLQSEVVWMVISLVVGLFLGVLWGLNTARGWLGMTWLIVPLTLIVQVIAVQRLPISSVKGIIMFGIISQLPNLFVSCGMAIHGFWKFMPRAGEAAAGGKL
jgi:O-antigen/teichoic acid export membrane protein